MKADGELIEIVVDQPVSRIDSYLAERTELSRSRIEQLIAAGHVTLNGVVPRKRASPQPGDVIAVRVPAAEATGIGAEPIPIEIIYQDTDLAVLNKPAGLVVHPAPGHRSGTLVNALLHALNDLSGIGGVLRPGIVHRLDRDTSGLLVVAKNDLAHQRLADALKRRRVRRRYLVASWGHLQTETITVDAPIGRDPRDRKRMAVVPEGRRAVTHFRVLERWASADYLSAELETGRTHQIRVHLRHVGHPVVGDRTYASGRERGFSGGARSWAAELSRRTERQFLHAAELRFEHPKSGEMMEFHSPLPADLEAVRRWAVGAQSAG